MTRQLAFLSISWPSRQGSLLDPEQTALACRSGQQGCGLDAPTGSGPRCPHSHARARVSVVAAEPRDEDSRVLFKTMSLLPFRPCFAQRQRDGREGLQSQIYTAFTTSTGSTASTASTAYTTASSDFWASCLACPRVLPLDVHRGH